MKTAMAAVAAVLCAGALAGCAGKGARVAGGEGMAPAAFELGARRFADAGDWIAIDEVESTGGSMDVGDTCVVRGRYALSSQEGATLGLFVTARGPAASTNDGRNRVRVERGEGSFVLETTLLREGWPHVSFYPAGGGESFGGVYFGAGEWLAKDAALVWGKPENEGR